MDLEFNIAKAFYKTFGLPLESDFKIDKKIVAPQHQDDGGFIMNDAMAQPLVSKLGTNFFKLDAFNRWYFLPATIYYNDLKTGVDVSFDLPNPVISIDCGKGIVSTGMVERPGSVHEIINTNDFIITIRGFIADPNNNYPEDDIRDLFEKAFKPDQSVKIKNALTDIFLQDNPSIVISKLSFPAVKGVIGVKPYEIQAMSDLIFDLEKVPK